jgi:ABC-2 type transport system ATP-binding protein
MSDVIVIRNLKKYFGKLHAVDGISFEVKKGEIFGFLGPNGAGKTTTIRCLMSFNKPTDGSVKILGFDMSNNSVAAKGRIGYLPGNVKLYDSWSGWDHIRLYENIRGKSNNLYELINRFEFNPNAKFRHLSSGNKQKLGLILALMHEPKLLIMDEPTIGLDPLLQLEIYKVLIEMRNRGATIFISSHNLPEVERLCNRVAIIRNGKLVTVEDINVIGNKQLHRVRVRFSDKFKRTEFEVDGVDVVEEIDDGLTLTISGDLNQIMQIITRYKIKDIEIAHASLEDVFIKFYERSK